MMLICQQFVCDYPIGGYIFVVLRFAAMTLVDVFIVCFLYFMLIILVIEKRIHGSP